MQPNPLTTLAQTDADFAVWLERWRAKRDETEATADAISKQINVDTETGHPISDREEARMDRTMLDAQLFFEVTVRHFPGIAPALRLPWEHAIEQYSRELGTCCSDGLEPW